MKTIKIEKKKILDWYDGPLSYYIEDKEGNSYYAHESGIKETRGHFFAVQFTFSDPFNTRQIMLDAKEVFEYSDLAPSSYQPILSEHLTESKHLSVPLVCIPIGDYEIYFNDYLDDKH
jgi:hypothetical protein